PFAFLLSRERHRMRDTPGFGSIAALSGTGSARHHARHCADRAVKAFSPLLAVEEQGDGLVDAPLAGVGALRAVDVVDVVPLHAVREIVEECSGSLIGR